MRINLFLNNSIKILHRFLSSSIKTPQTSKTNDVFLILKTSNDPGGAFKGPTPFRDSILSQNGKIKVIKKTVSSINEVIEEINLLKKEGKVIKGICFDVHGSPCSLTLGKESQENDHIITNSRIKTRSGKIISPNTGALKEAFNQIDEKGVIILNACSSGKKDKNHQSIAESIAELAPGKKIYAPSTSISVRSCSIKYSKKLNVKFYSAKKSKKEGVQEKITNYFNIFLYLFGNIRQDVTVKLKKHEPKL